MPAARPFSFLISQTSEALLSSFVLLGPLQLFGPAVWSYVTANFTDFQILFVATFVISTGSFWLLSLLFGVLDLYRFPKQLWRFKVQPNRLPTAEWYRKASYQAAFLQLVVNLPITYLYYVHVSSSGRDFRSEPVPGLAEVLKHLAVFAVFEELGFYYGHRFLHLKWWYKRVHKKHHEFKAPIAVAAIYAHPLEHFLSNIFPLSLGPLLMGSHVLLFWLWVNFGQMTAMSGHCGFAIPYLTSPLAHDYHHQVFNANYGTLGVLDWWHGTTGNFEAWRKTWESGVKVAEQGKEFSDEEDAGKKANGAAMAKQD